MFALRNFQYLMLRFSHCEHFSKEFRDFLAGTCAMITAFDFLNWSMRCLTFKIKYLMIHVTTYAYTN